MEIVATSTAFQPQQQVCPTCQAQIPITIGYTTWCEQCNWNLDSRDLDQSRSRFDSVYLSLGKKLGERMYTEVVKAQSIKPSLTISKALAFLIASAVHTMTLGCACLGLWLVIAGMPRGMSIISGLCCLLVAWGLRPRVPKMPSSIVPREAAPMLYDLADRIAQALGTTQLHGIVIDSRFNASFRQCGLRRAKIVCLGLPLVSVLEGHELVALMAHELAHSANGDSSRSMFVGSAIDALVAWHGTLRPTRIVYSRGVIGFVMTILSLAMLLVSSLAWMVAYALIHLLWRDKQRAEYLADYLAATVGGTDAMISLSEKLRFGHTFNETLQRIRFVQKNQDVIATLRERIMHMPEREKVRLERMESSEGLQLDVTHPPTSYRARFLETRCIAEPNLTLSPSDFEQIQRELIPYYAAIQQDLVAMHR